MIVHDFAALPEIIGRAILTIAATTGLGAALLVAGIWGLTSMATGNWPRRRTTKPTPEYEEAA